MNFRQLTQIFLSSEKPFPAVFAMAALLGMLSLAWTTSGFAADELGLRDKLSLQEQALNALESRLGPDNPELIPQLKDLVTTHVALNDTGPVADYLQRIRSLSALDGDPETLLGAIEAQAHWHLTEGTPYLIVPNYFIARNLIDELERTAVGLYEDSYSDLAPWLYAVAMNRHQLFGLLNGETEVRFAAAVEVRRRDQRRVGNLYLWSTNQITLGPEARFNTKPDSTNLRWSRAGGRYLREAEFRNKLIAAIQRETGNIEGQAMARIYQADLEMLLRQSNALDGYRQAQQLLRQAAVPEDRIRLFFSRPQVVPGNRFFATLEEAIAHQEASLADAPPQPKNLRQLAPFVAWSEYAASVPEPVSIYAFWNREIIYDEIDLRLQINSLGYLTNIRVVNAEPNESRPRRIARQATRSLRFRPAMSNGQWQRWSDVHMRFLIPRVDGRRPSDSK